VGTKFLNVCVCGIGVAQEFFKNFWPEPNQGGTVYSTCPTTLPTPLLREAPPGSYLPKWTDTQMILWRITGDDR